MSTKTIRLAARARISVYKKCSRTTLTHNRTSNLAIAIICIQMATSFYCVFKQKLKKCCILDNCHPQQIKFQLWAFVSIPEDFQGLGKFSCIILIQDTQIVPQLFYAILPLLCIRAVRNAGQNKHLSSYPPSAVNPYCKLLSTATKGLLLLDYLPQALSSLPSEQSSSPSHFQSKGIQRPLLQGNWDSSHFVFAPLMKRKEPEPLCYLALLPLLHPILKQMFSCWSQVLNYFIVATFVNHDSRTRSFPSL